MTVSLPLGFVPLVDAAPLIVAAEFGFAEAEGLRLDLRKAASWSMLRDMLDFGQVVAAQMLSVVPVAKALGLGGGKQPLEVPMVLSLNGQVVGISEKVAHRMADYAPGVHFGHAASAGRALAQVSGSLRIGAPFPFSMHTELLRYWLNGLGLQVMPLIEIRTVPPQLMAEALMAEEIDAFCVGEPWGSHAVDAAGAELLLPGAAIWSQAPEKVLATRAGWCEAEPELAGRLLRSIWRAGRWLSDPINSITVSEVLARPAYLNLSSELLEHALSGRMLTARLGPELVVPQFLEFHSGVANFPWRSQAAWIAGQLVKRFGLPGVASIEAARATFRSDLYRQHLAEEGADLPISSDKAEGALGEPMPVAAKRGTLILNRNRFFDGKIFDPTALV
jgi:two-component system, oxyanion-binding sensor